MLCFPWNLSEKLSYRCTENIHLSASSRLVLVVLPHFIIALRLGWLFLHFGSCSSSGEHALTTTKRRKRTTWDQRTICAPFPFSNKWGQALCENSRVSSLGEVFQIRTKRPFLRVALQLKIRGSFFFPCSCDKSIVSRDRYYFLCFCNLSGLPFSCCREIKCEKNCVLVDDLNAHVPCMNLFSKLCVCTKNRTGARYLCPRDLSK